LVGTESEKYSVDVFLLVIIIIRSLKAMTERQIVPELAASVYEMRSK
jgi:hypothetical protein